MKAFTLCLFICLALTLSLSGAYLTDVPMTLTQPDGTEINCFASGDEFHNWLHDSENYIIIQDNQSGYYTYAQKTSDRVLPSELIVGRDNPTQSRLTPGINISEQQYKIKRAAWLQDTPASVKTPNAGLINNLVVFIRFSDQTEFTVPFATYNEMFNSTVPGTNSMFNYFQETSYQALQIQTTFYPIPVNHMVVSYQDSLPRTYYLPYSTTNPTGYVDDTDRRIREHTLLMNAIYYIDELVPVGLNLDGDNDGNVDNVCFIVKGSSGAWADLLWPHKWSLYTFEVMLNGARVYTYNFQLENSLTSSGVGVLCHEMSHSVGFPDLYHYTSNGITPVGRWDIMETNRNPPQHHTTYTKIRYANWLPPMRQITQSGTYWVNKITNPENNCYKIMANNPQYFYVVEFRKQEGFFESSIPGTGLIIYRIDTSEDGTGNADGPPDEVYIYRPNGTPTSNGSPLSAHYSLETGRTAINSTTVPSPFLSDGSQGGLNITQIGSSAGDSISFYITVGAVPPMDYDEGFESGDFTAYPWTMSGDMGWVTDSTVTYEGRYSAKTGPIDHLQTSSLSLSVQVPAQYAYIGFRRKISSESGYDYLRFYIDDVQKAQWSGSSNWSYVQFPINMGSHTLRWTYSKDQGVDSGSDCAWIDNILFRWDADVLAPPQNFQAITQPEDLSNLLTWQPPNATTAQLGGYRIFKDNIQIADIDTTNLSYVDDYVLPGALHTYYIKAFYANPNGHSSATDTLTVRVTGTPIIPELISADVIDTTDVHLQWVLPEMNRGIIGYNIYRDGVIIHTINDGNVFEWTDTDLPEGAYVYQVNAIYPAFETELSNSILVVVFIFVTTEDEITSPIPFGINKANPNPFSQSVSINFGVDKDNSDIDISIYNIKGQKIKTLFNGVKSKGMYQVVWNADDNQGREASSGVYFCRIASKDKVRAKSILLVK